MPGERCFAEAKRIGKMAASIRLIPGLSIGMPVYNVDIRAEFGSYGHFTLCLAAR